jgi:hypothetical protein
VEISKGGRELFKARTGDNIEIKDTKIEMIQRVMPDPTGMKGILALDVEAQHRYREKPTICPLATIS